MASKTNPFIVFAIILMGVVFGWFYYSQFISANIELANPSPVKPADKLLDFNNLSLNFNLFDDTTFKSLTVFGEAPVKPGTPGKNNPFSQ